MDVLHAIHEEPMPLTGLGLSLNRNVNSCRQPLGHVMHHRPTTTETNVLHTTMACQRQHVGCMQSFFIDLKSLSSVSGLNSGIYSALTVSFVLAGLTYIGLPSQTLTAIFGSAAEKGLEDICLWQLIGTAVSMAVAPIAFTQQVSWSPKGICLAHVACEYCSKMQAMQHQCNDTECASAKVHISNAHML